MNNPKYVGFEPEDHGEFFIGIEKIANIVEEIKVLHKAHWEETEGYKQGEADPNYLAYIALEEKGQFALFTVRSKKTTDLVGYLKYFVFESIHQTGRMEAREDAIYIAKEARKGGLATHLLKYAIEVFKKMGVHQVGMSSKAPCGGPDLGKLLRRQGFAPVAIFYYKDITDSGEE